MRIAIVTDYYYPSLGGITEHVHGQALGLQRLGHEVTVIAANVKRAPRVVDSGHAPEDHVPFEIIRYGRSFGFYGNGAQTLSTFHPRMFGHLKKLFRERRFDVIHTHAPYNPSFVQAVPFVAPSTSITVGTFHSVFPKTTLMNIAGPILRKSIDRLDGRIVVSDACIESLDPYFPGEYTVIPNGIDEQHFSPLAEPLPEFADGRQNILYLGRFDPRNGLETMIRAFTKIRRQRGDTVRLIVVGDGPLRTHYQRQVPEDIAGSIAWVGRVNWDRPRYFASADVLCTPCERASFGMVLLEAMSCGVPVVASRISGFQLVMEHDRQGLFISNPKDATGFADGITSLLDDPQRRECMARAGRHTAVTQYAWSCVANRLEQYYANLIEARGPR